MLEDWVEGKHDW